MVLGTDVSSYSGQIDWEGVSGVRFALARIGTTKTPTDELFHHNWVGIGHRCPFTLEELTRHGIRRGGYWFSYPDPSEKGRDGADDARRCVLTLRHAPGSVRDTDLLVFDVEDQETDPRWSKLTRKERKLYADSWMAEAEDHFQRRGLVYGGQYHIRDMFGATWKPRDWHTMVSYYDSDPDWLDTPFVDRMLVWQHAGDGVGAEPRRVRGIGGNVDVSRLVNTTTESFMRYGCRRHIGGGQGET